MATTRTDAVSGLPRDVRVPTGRVVAVVGLAGVLLGGPSTLPAFAQGRAQTPEERAAICAEADERVKEILAAKPAPAGAAVVAIWKETFCPALVTLPKGGTLHVVNVEKRTSHSVWFKADGRAESERFFPEESVDVTADLTEGEHDYVCGPHPWMTGRVKIEGAKP